jgi:hypothetical protein
MLPFGVTIPATVPQGSEIPEGLMNNPVYIVLTLTAARGLRKWLPHFICSNFIIVGLNTEPLLAQNIHLLSYTSLSSPWGLPDGFTEPFFGDDAACAVSVPLSTHRGRFNTQCVQVLSLSANYRQLTMNI